MRDNAPDYVVDDVTECVVLNELVQASNGNSIQRVDWDITAMFDWMWSGLKKLFSFVF